MLDTVIYIIISHSRAHRDLIISKWNGGGGGKRAHIYLKISRFVFRSPRNRSILFCTRERTIFTFEARTRSLSYYKENARRRHPDLCIIHEIQLLSPSRGCNAVAGSRIRFSTWPKLLSLSFREIVFSGNGVIYVIKITTINTEARYLSLRSARAFVGCRGGAGVSKNRSSVVPPRGFHR